MLVSVVICTHSMRRYDDVTDAIESVRTQTYDNVETVVVVDGNEPLYDRLRREYDDLADCLVHCNDDNRGVSASRTIGARLASGDVVAFLDDDAIAQPDWVERLVDVYEQTDAIAVGGRMTGEWLAGRPWYLPAEFDWLVGVTHPGFAEAGAEIRNTFESNISFRREPFLELSGFDPAFGPDAESYRHSEGAELGTRLQGEFGRGVVYEPDAVVSHKVFEHRTKLSWLLRRAFKQGVSKRQLADRQENSNGSESAYLRDLLTVHVPNRCRSFVRSRSPVELGRALMILVFTATVGLGYLWALVTNR
jgi:glycosyltransferase involved in cell wall biosynthesis